MIHIKNAKKTFGDLVVFDHLNLNIDKPGLYFLCGSSGSGKSTLLNLLAGYDTFDSGEIQIDSNIATIFQNYELILEMNAKENIFLDVDCDVKKHEDLFKQLGILNLLDHYPNELSGGQQQRIGIARALLLKPNIILCDEPTESLDIDNKLIVMDLLKKLAENKVVIVVSHDIQMANEYAEHIYYIQDKKLVSKNEYHTDKIMSYEKKKEFDKEVVSRFVHKIIYKRTILLTIILFLLTSMLQGLYLYEQRLLYIPTSKKVLNANMVYLEAVGNNESLKEAGLEPILEFAKTRIDTELYDFNIYPFVENTFDLVIEGALPNKNKVIVNQNVLDVLQNNKTIDLKYLIGVSEYDLDVEICGVIYEEDTDLLNIYYNLDDVLDILDEYEYDYGISFKGYIEEYGMYFQDKVGYEAIEDYYNENQGNKTYLKSPLYDERVDYESGLEVFKLVYKVIELSLFMVIVLFVLITMNYDTNSYIKTCTILCSQGIDLQMLKKIYIKEKTQLFVVLLIVGCLFMLGIGYIYLTDVLLLRDYLFILFIVTTVIIIYLLTLLIHSNKIKMDKIAQLLKNEN